MQQNNHLSNIFKLLYSILIYILLLINIAIIGINAAIFIILTNNQSFVAVDFNSLYTGFKIVGNGDGAKLYDLDLQTKYQQEIMRNAQFEEGVLPYVTAPFIAILFSPLSKVSINVAFYIWTLGELLLLIWSLLLINKLFTSWTKKERLCTLLTILAFWPLTLTFLLGQLSLILFFCLFQMYLAFRKLQYYKSGIWLALLSAKPQVLLIPFFITTNKRRFRSALSVIISCFSLFILTGIILGFSSWRQYIDLLLFIGSKFGKYGYHPELQYTLRGLLTTIFGYQHSSLINILSIATFIIGSLFIGLLWGRFHSEDITRFNLYFAFTIILSLFVSMYIYPHDDLLLVLPAVIFYDFLRNKNYPRKVFSILLLTSPLIFITTSLMNIHLFGIIQPPILLILILLIWIGVYLLRDILLDHKITKNYYQPDTV